MNNCDCNRIEARWYKTHMVAKLLQSRDDRHTIYDDMITTEFRNIPAKMKKALKKHRNIDINNSRRWNLRSFPGGNFFGHR